VIFTGVAGAAAAIKAAFVDAVGHSNVYWEDEDNAGNWAPYDVSTVKLSLTTMVREQDPREEQDDNENETTLSTPYVFTVRAIAEDLQNTGQALETLTQAVNRFGFTEYRAVWCGNGIAIVDLPLSPTRLNRTVDGRTLNVFAIDVRIRAVLTTTLATVGTPVEIVTGEGTLQPGDVPVPFDTSEA